MTQAIPELTKEEAALAGQAEHANERLPLETVLRYLHWAKARAELLDAIAKEPKQLALVKEQINDAGRPGMHLPMDKVIDEEGDSDV